MDRLIELRKRMGVSQAKMAELLGYKSGIRISEIESGKKVMSGQALKCLEYLEMIWDQAWISDDLDKLHTLLGIFEPVN